LTYVERFFSVLGTKIGEKQSRQFHYAMCYFLQKAIYGVQGVWGKAGYFSRISVLKVTLQSVVTFNSKLQKKIGGAARNSQSCSNFLSKLKTHYFNIAFYNHIG